MTDLFALFAHCRGCQAFTKAGCSEGVWATRTVFEKPPPTTPCEMWAEKPRKPRDDTKVKEYWERYRKEAKAERARLYKRFKASNLCRSAFRDEERIGWDKLKQAIAENEKPTERIDG